MNINLMVELKKVYTQNLQTTLTPVIYEGLQSIYIEAKNNSQNTNEILKTFQGLLKLIPQWNLNIVEKEKGRVMEKMPPFFVKLLQAVFKTNLIVLSENNIPEDLMREVNLNKFIHQVYIECARIFWMDPFVFYHNGTPIELKNNRNIVLDKIHTAIENAIYKLLNWNLILDKYLGLEHKNESDIEKLLDIKLQVTNNKQVVEQNITPTQQQKGGSNDKLLDIINNVKLSESEKGFNSNVNYVTPTRNSSKHSSKHSFNKSRSSSNKSSETIKKIIHESINNSRIQSAKDSIDSKIKQNVINNLHSETMTYNPESDANNYQDIFGNDDEDKNETLNTMENNENKSKEKFFNNYLNV